MTNLEGRLNRINCRCEKFLQTVFFSLKIIIFVVSLFIRHENQNLSVCIDLSYLFYSELLINERCLKVCILIWSKICESRGVHYDITAQNIGRFILLPFQEQQRKFKMKKQLCTLFEFQRETNSGWKESPAHQNPLIRLYKGRQMSTSQSDVRGIE